METIDKIKLMVKNLLDNVDLLCIATDNVDYDGLPANIADKMRRNLVALDYEIYQLPTPPTKPTSSDIRTDHTTK